jgi:hypothetical protein
VYPGWLALGSGDPIYGAPYIEIVNNARVFAYARNMGICWLQECEDCETANQVLPGGGVYTSPGQDHAPWFDPDNPDTWGFLGVVGLDVQGDFTSTRAVTVSNAVTFGGVLGPPYFGPRTLVVRCLAVAVDECSLTAGLEWLNFFAGNPEEPCLGDNLTFFDCCPCMCEDDDAEGQCWPNDYDSFNAGPACDTDNLWPATYDELILGPDPSLGPWCLWPRIYNDLNAGPPSWSCCAHSCVVPYLRQYYNAMITGGPTVIQHPKMNTSGAMAEFELTIVAANPAKHTLPDPFSPLPPDSGGVLITDPPDPVVEPTPDPFDLPGVTSMRSLARTLTRTEPLPAFTPAMQWLRRELPWHAPEGRSFSEKAPVIQIVSYSEQAEQVRIGLWAGDVRLAGWLIPFIPPNTILTIDNSRRVAIVNHSGEIRRLGAFVRDWRGDPIKYISVPHGNYRLTIDQEVDKAVRLLLRASAVSVS